VALPPVQSPQFAADDFGKANLGIFNATVSSITRRINALTPPNPNVSLKQQFVPQFLEDDFKKEGLSFINQQLQTIAQNTNGLRPRGDAVVPPVQIVQLRLEDFAEPSVPVVQQYLTSIVNRLNAVARF
jgi:hypothetical protein